MVLYVLEVLFVVLVALFVVTQLIVPWSKRTPTLPLFRREHRLSESLDEAEEGVREARLEREISKRHRAAERIRPNTPDPNDETR